MTSYVYGYGYVNPETIPRYAEPTWDELAEVEPIPGTCANCIHKVVVNLDGTDYMLCVQERDDKKPQEHGEVNECDPDETECADWEWDERE